MRIATILLLLSSTIKATDTLNLTFGYAPESKPGILGRRFSDEINNRLDSTLFLTFFFSRREELL